MGDEAAFYSEEGVADPKLVERLSVLNPAPRDPELLARLLDGIAGTDIALELVGFERRKREARTLIIREMKLLQRAARSLASLRDADSNFDLLGIGIEELLVGAGDKERAAIAFRTAEALSHLAAVDVLPNAARFAVKPKADEAVFRIVLAVATYLRREGKPFSGEPRRTQTSDGPVYLIKSEAARLVASVLALLGAPLSARELATQMRHVRRHLSGK